MVLSSAARKMVLAFTVAILSIAILALPAAAKHPSKNQLLIEAVSVDFGDDPTITIDGQNFDSKKKKQDDDDDDNDSDSDKKKEKN